MISLWLRPITIVLASSGSMHHGVDDPLLKLFGRRDPFAGEVEAPESVDHCGENLSPGEFDAGRKLGVLADLIEVIDLLAVERGDDAVGVVVQRVVPSFHDGCSPQKNQTSCEKDA